MDNRVQVIAAGPCMCAGPCASAMLGRARRFVIREISRITDPGRENCAVSGGPGSHRRDSGCMGPGVAGVTVTQARHTHIHAYDYRSGNSCKYTCTYRCCVYINVYVCMWLRLRAYMYTHTCTQLQADLDTVLARYVRFKYICAYWCAYVALA